MRAGCHIHRGKRNHQIDGTSDASTGAPRFNDLKSFLRELDARGLLVRVSEPVDTELEITEIADRAMKKPGGGSAVFFEKPRIGFETSQIPVFINAFGSDERMRLALGVTGWDVPAGRVASLLKPEIPQGMMDKLSMLPKLAELASFVPKRVRYGPCREVIAAGADAGFSRLPILKCWPGDAGRYITLGITVTADPQTRVCNYGIYRIQILDDKTAMIHWQTHKDGRSHCGRWRALGKKMPAAIVIGADPATVYAASAPMPPGMDELLLAGFLRRAPVETIDACGGELQIPAESEIVLEGWIDPNELKPEGPFGDHAGHYSKEGDFPVFHLEAVTHRKNPVYLTTIVGFPPTEDYYFGKATERIFLPVIKTLLPEVADINFPAEGIFNNCCIVSIRKSYPGHARKVCHALWGLGQMMLTKILIVVEDTVDVQNIPEVAFHAMNNIDPKRDLFFVEGPVDDLNFAAPAPSFGSKMGVDATKKFAQEGHPRHWPEMIKMLQSVRQQVSDKWRAYGFKE